MRIFRALYLLLIVMLCCARSSAQTLTTLLTFNGTDVGIPEGSLVQGTDGNFYGTTSVGDVGSCTGPFYGCGTVFKITPGGTLTTLHSFNIVDGINPRAGLTLANDGNFYGTTSSGGVSGDYSSAGTIFKITPVGTLTTLYTFSEMTNGIFPSKMIQATDGNFYGTTSDWADNTGSYYNTSAIFKITPGGTLTTLCNLDNPSAGVPSVGLVQATDGNFYGTTYDGGAYGYGTIFKVTMNGNLTTLYAFGENDTDGAHPQGGLIQATDGNLYGTTTNGATDAAQFGTVFKITLGGVLTTLFDFGATDDAFSCAGDYPEAGLIQATDGNLYGTTSTINNCGSATGGTIFKITPEGVLTTLYSFTGGSDGDAPVAGLVQGTDGSLYGTTSLGGSGVFIGGLEGGDGTVFRFTLTSPPPLPEIAEGGVVNAASAQAGIVSNSWIAIFGNNLSSITDNWANAIVNGNLPTSLDGVSISVGGQPAYISYISPTQIDALTPNVGTGVVSVTVTNQNGTSATTAVSQAVKQPSSSGATTRSLRGKITATHTPARRPFQPSQAKSSFFGELVSARRILPRRWVLGCPPPLLITPLAL